MRGDLEVDEKVGVDNRGEKEMAAKEPATNAANQAIASTRTKMLQDLTS